MKTFTNENFSQLLSIKQGPCISLYQPTHRHHPENQQDPIRFRNLVREIESSLQKQFPNDTVKELLKPFEILATDKDFWNHSLDGLAIFCKENLFQVYGLQHNVEELAVVANSFHLKPLKKYLQTNDRFQVLCIDRQEIKLLEGNRNQLDEIELAPDVPRTIKEALGTELTEEHLTVASYGGVSNSPNIHGHGGRKDELDTDTERFFREVDRAITKHHSKISDLPLVLAALPEYHAAFHSVSHNPLLLEDGIRINPKSLTHEQLKEAAWKIFEPLYLTQLEKEADAYNLAASKNLGTDDLKKAAKAAMEGRIATLLVEENKTIAGKIINNQGSIKIEKLEEPDVDDVLDDLSELVLKMGGNVLILPSEKMPTQTGLAATFRY